VQQATRNGRPDTIDDPNSIDRALTGPTILRVSSATTYIQNRHD